MFPHEHVKILYKVFARTGIIPTWDVVSRLKETRSTQDQLSLLYLEMFAYSRFSRDSEARKILDELDDYAPDTEYLYTNT